MQKLILLLLILNGNAIASNVSSWCPTKSSCWTESTEKVDHKEVIKPAHNVSSKETRNAQSVTNYTLRTKIAHKVQNVALNVRTTVRTTVRTAIHKVTYEEINTGSKALTGQSNRDIECLAYSMYREAGNQSVQAQYAVGQVHINRLLSGDWGNSMCQVVYAKAQFSWTLESKKAQWSQFDRDVFMTLAANMMVDGYRVKSLANIGILHYHANYVNPTWAKKSQVVATAGAHIFYKNIAH